MVVVAVEKSVEFVHTYQDRAHTEGDEVAYEVAGDVSVAGKGQADQEKIHNDLTEWASVAGVVNVMLFAVEQAVVVVASKVVGYTCFQHNY